MITSLCSFRCRLIIAGLLWLVLCASTYQGWSVRVDEFAAHNKVIARAEDKLADRFGHRGSGTRPAPVAAPEHVSRSHRRAPVTGYPAAVRQTAATRLVTGSGTIAGAAHAPAGHSSHGHRRDQEVADHGHGHQGQGPQAHVDPQAAGHGSSVDGPEPTGADFGVGGGVPATPGHGHGHSNGVAQGHAHGHAQVPPGHSAEHAAEHSVGHGPHPHSTAPAATPAAPSSHPTPSHPAAPSHPAPSHPSPAHGPSTAHHTHPAHPTHPAHGHGHGHGHGH